MIRINLFIEVDKENKEQVNQLGKLLAESTLKDKGTIAYDIYESKSRSNVLLICETWLDEVSLSMHENTKHYTTIVPQLQRLYKMKKEQFEFRK